MLNNFLNFRARINAYRALASPSLICLSSKDPFLTAFELSWELRRLAKAEAEFRAEYNVSDPMVLLLWIKRFDDYNSEISSFFLIKIVLYKDNFIYKLEIRINQTYFCEMHRSLTIHK